jgi:hypothetical protein
MLKGDLSGGRRAAAIVIGLLASATGFLVASLSGLANRRAAGAA